MFDSMRPFSYCIQVLLLTLTVSCIQKKNETTQASKPVSEPIAYYYEEFNSFKLIERSDLNILKLVNLDTLIYVSSSERKGRYDEYHGKLTRLNDSLYSVRCYKHVEQWGNRVKPMVVAEDSLYFQCDSTLINQELTVQYANYQSKRFKIRSTSNLYKLDKKFYSKPGDKLFLSFGYRHPIVNELVILKYDYDANASFRIKTSAPGFYVVIDSTYIKTLNTVAEGGRRAIGPKFFLRRFTKKDGLSQGRKLYKLKNSQD
ncbi:MAG TPA: hypothetical protein DCS93_27020 [Microscillaceae bacterium]|nr:hypothetical protein [Microscillaceae bacterium]